jgi:RimJ/RimL family protein N-acetyltransferase
MSAIDIRPIGHGDRDALAAAFDALSPRSREQRFLGPKPRLSTRELTYFTEIDHVDHVALVAVERASGRIVGVSRYATALPGDPVADLAVVVADEWQRRGIGTALAARVVERARANGIACLTGSTFVGNAPARALLARLGFRVRSASGGVMELELDLVAAWIDARAA